MPQRILIASFALVLAASAGGQEFRTTPINQSGRYRVVVLAFTQKDCPYCRDAAPTWELLRKDGETVETVDVVASAGMARAYDVTGTPTTVIGVREQGSTFVRPISRVDGSRPLDAYREKIIAAKKRIAGIPEGLPPWPADIRERPEGQK